MRKQETKSGNSKKNVNQLGKPEEYSEFRIPEFNRRDIEQQSQISIRTGKSLIFPRHQDVEVLDCTPPKKESYVRMEDTFWSKKKKLIPDYSVMEKIDAHVLKVSHLLSYECSETYFQLKALDNLRNGNQAQAEYENQC